jgi:hypothetical protein
MRIVFEKLFSALAFLRIAAVARCGAFNLSSRCYAVTA